LSSDDKIGELFNELMDARKSFSQSLIVKRSMRQLGALCLLLMPMHALAANDGSMTALPEAANQQQSVQDRSLEVNQLGFELVTRFFHQLSLTGSASGVIGRPKIDDSNQKVQ